jgi:hypothetical protein
MNRILISIVLALSMSAPVFAQPNPPLAKLTPAEAEAEAARLQSMFLWTVGIVVGVVVVSLGVTLLPVVIAIWRGHPDTLAISLVAIFLGWTFLGWFIALIWSVKSFPRNPDGDARDY